jgi:hypothetical protein
VANFVETEYGLEYFGIACSHIQVRGSVPVFWCQTGVKAKLSVTKSGEQTYPAFKKHIEELISDYNNIFILNLLKEKKAKEVRLTKAFEAQVKSYDLECKNRFQEERLHDPNASQGLSKSVIENECTNQRTTLGLAYSHAHSQSQSQSIPSNRIHSLLTNSFVRKTRSLGQKYQYNHVKYEFFDFHGKCSKDVCVQTYSSNHYRIIQNLKSFCIK